MAFNEKVYRELLEKEIEVYKQELYFRLCLLNMTCPECNNQLIRTDPEKRYKCQNCDYSCHDVFIPRRLYEMDLFIEILDKLNRGE